jgi:hypothetical protein
MAMGLSSPKDMNPKLKTKIASPNPSKTTKGQRKNQYPRIEDNGSGKTLGKTHLNPQRKAEVKNHKLAKKNLRSPPGPKPSKAKLTHSKSLTNKKQS